MNNEILWFPAPLVLEPSPWWLHTVLAIKDVLRAFIWEALCADVSLPRSLFVSLTHINLHVDAMLISTPATTAAVALLKRPHDPSLPQNSTAISTKDPNVTSCSEQSLPKQFSAPHPSSLQDWKRVYTSLQLCISKYLHNLESRAAWLIHGISKMNTSLWAELKMEQLKLHTPT